MKKIIFALAILALLLVAAGKPLSMQVYGTTPAPGDTITAKINGVQVGTTVAADAGGKYAVFKMRVGWFRNAEVVDVYLNGRHCAQVAFFHLAKVAVDCR
jgi:hypothetical protein